ncbi:MAG: glucose-6-phosphate dehydrogenase, partial [Actinomycetota bacterium]
MGPPVRPEADCLVLFGASGDLARKKLLPALYELTRQGRLEMPVIGVADSDWFNEDFADRAREAVTEYVGDDGDLDTEALGRLCDRLMFISGDYSEAATWRQLSAATEDAKVAVAFLAIPPTLFDAVVKGLDAIMLA